MDIHVCTCVHVKRKKIWSHPKVFLMVTGIMEGISGKTVFPFLAAYFSIFSVFPFYNECVCSFNNKCITE